MKKILLISNHVFHYRINNYNYFAKRFKEIGYEFMVLTNKAQKVDFDINFNLKIINPSYSAYRKYIKEINPDVVILFLHLKDIIIFPLMYYCKIKKIPVIHWNFGINVIKPNAIIKNLLYYHLHKLSSAILLYSPNELTYIKKKNKNKTFVALNTINYSDFDRKEITDNKYIHKKFGVKEKKIVLFTGRLIPSKKVEILLQCFRNSNDIAVVIAGKGINEEILKIIDQYSNYYYLGEIKYDKLEIARIFNSCDIFCIPGNLGLALIDAFFWGKPVITLNGRNSPEIYYLKDGENGFLAEDAKDIESKIMKLLNNEELYKKFSKNALKTYETEMHIENMFKGFKDVVNFVTKTS